MAAKAAAARVKQVAPTAEYTSDKFTAVMRTNVEQAAAAEWLKNAEINIYGAQSKLKKPATKVTDPLNPAAPKIKR